MSEHPTAELLFTRQEIRYLGNAATAANDDELRGVMLVAERECAVNCAVSNTITLDSLHLVTLSLGAALNAEGAKLGVVTLNYADLYRRLSQTAADLLGLQARAKLDAEQVGFYGFPRNQEETS